MRARPELLAPAGDPEKLAVAYRFGADAAYFGVRSLSLRAQAEGFPDVSAAVALAHARGKKLHAAVNLFARDDDFGAIGDALSALAEAGADGVIASDLGVISLCRKRFPALPVHVSTQANTLNTAAALAYADMGCKRIVLARELRLSEIAKIAHGVQNRIELECFVHGALCVSYSGRCLLSDYLTGRASNRGRCVQACRFSYEVRAAGTDGASMPLDEDGRGTYLFNSADLCLIRRLKDLRDAGVDAFKIEGRNKTAYYVATVVNAYRRALDGIDAPFDEALYEECRAASNRGFCEGFCFDDARENADSAALSQSCTFVAVVTAVEGRRATVSMRNRFRKGDLLEVLSPTLRDARFVAANIVDESGAPVDDVKRVGQTVRLDVPDGVRAGDFLRRPEVTQ